MTRSAAPQASLIWAPTLDLAALSRTYTVQVHAAATASYVPHEAVTHVSLHHGGLWLDDRRIADPEFRRGFVRFAHKTSSRYAAGVLSFTPDALALTGTLFLGADEAGAVRYDIVAITPPTIYATQIAVPGAVAPAGHSFPEWSPEQPTDPGEWTAGLEFVLGYDMPSQGGLPTPIYRIQDPTGARTPLNLVGCAPSVRSDGSLVVTLNDPDPDLAGLGVAQLGADFPAAFVIEFSWDGTSFNGVLQRVDPETSLPETEQHAWRGTAPPAGPASPAAPVMLAKVDLATPAEPSVAQDLSIAELFTLQPDAATLQQVQFAMLLDNMKWALAKDPAKQDWVSTFLGQVPPQDIGDVRVKLIQKNPTFYTDRFAVGYLGRSLNELSGPAAPNTKLSPQQAVDLDFYLRAGLAADPAYTTQTQGIFLNAFVKAAPRLALYIQDTSTDWAQALFEQLVTPVQMNIAVNKIIAGEGTAESNRHSTILQALQPSGDLAKQFHRQLVAATLPRTLSHLNLDDKTAVESWLGDAIQGFITAFLDNGLSVPGTDPAAQAAMQLQAEQLRQAAQAAGGVAQLAAGLADLAIAASGVGSWEKLGNIEGAWAKAGLQIRGRGVRALDRWQSVHGRELVRKLEQPIRHRQGRGRRQCDRRYGQDRQGRP